MLKYRWLIITSAMVITAFFGWHMLQVEIDPDIKNNIPRDMPSRLNTSEIEALFGKDNILLVVFESEDILDKQSLQRIKTITKKMERLKSFDRIISPANAKHIKGEDGMMIIDPAIHRIPKTDKQIEDLRIELSENPLVYNVTISKDFTMAAIIADVNPEYTDSEVLQQIETLIADVPGEEIIHIGGMPAIRARINKDVQRDMSMLLPAGLLIMLVMLFVFFKQMRGVFLPFGVVIMSIIIGMGLIPLLGWKLSMISILLPIILIAVANDYGIHMIARYQELIMIHGDLPAKQIAVRIFRDLFRPIMLTAVTTIMGILALLSHVMIPAKQLGILAAISIGAALVLSLFLIPAVLSLLKRSQPAFSARKKSQFVDNILSAVAGMVNKYPRKILYGFLVLAVIMISGLIMVKVDANIENFFTDDHPVKKSSQIINENFGGSQSISILIEGDIKNPEILEQMDYYESEIKKIAGVGDAYSVTTLIKEMNKAMQDTISNSESLPASRNAVAQLLELYNMSGDPEDFEKLVDFDFERARIMVKLNDASSTNVLKILEEIEELTAEDASVKLIGGEGLITAELADTVVDGQIYSLVLALVVVALLMMIIFRSPMAGLITSVPLAGSILVLFGLMGFLNIPLDIATALLSSVMIGVGVDYTIHFIWRYREEIQNGEDKKEAIQITLTTTGRGIVFNALSVIIGFSALLISAFAPIKFFGFLIVISIFACLVGALVLVPSLILVWKPKFLEGRPDETKTEYRQVA
jgi:hydrophobe/amphiphile efflux-3 (HAE3) family protein